MRRRFPLLLFAFLTTTAVVAAIAAGARASGNDFDLVLVGGRIVDGTGNPWFTADVGIKDGRIAEIGRLSRERAAKVLDVSGKTVAPGFIDAHVHAEGGLEQWPGADNFVRDGVTTLVTGNCGTSALPLRDWFSTLEKSGVSLNVASLIGHNTVRHAAMGGDRDAAPTPTELDAMRGLVRQAMADGAIGFSTGLEYVPGSWASLDELVALARESAAAGGIYATHLRDEGIRIEEAIQEALAIGERASCPVEISHLKISARNRWGRSARVVELIEQARAKGLQVTADQYVYTAGSTTLDILFPSWVFDGGDAAAERRLKDPDTRARVRQEMVAKAAGQGFTDFSFVQIASCKAKPAYAGRRLPEIAAAEHKPATAAAQADVAIDIRLAGGADVVVHKMSDGDVDRFLVQPFTMIGSDASPMTEAEEGNPHPRSFGNAARLLSRYVRERRLLGLEEAVRKMTSLPAQTFKLWDRGVLRPGFAADIVVFDPARVADHATFESPKRFSEGLDFVLVNGVVVVDHDVHTKARPGRILRGRPTT